MNPGEGAADEEPLANRYAVLWDKGEVPDLFAFLGAHPEASMQERFEVMRVDQRRRRRGSSAGPVDHDPIGTDEFPPRAEDCDGSMSETLRLARDSCGFDVIEMSEDTNADDPAGAPPGPSTTQGTSTKADEIADAGAEPVPGPEPELGSTRSLHLRSTDAGVAENGGEGGPPCAAADESSEGLGHAARFEIGRRLGTGGMGVVYQAYDRVRGETLALKTMRRADPKALYRFKQEFRTLSDLIHPNLVNLYELFAIGDLWFFTMELIEGTDFISHVRSRPVGTGVEEAGPPEDLAGPNWDRLRGALRQLVEGVLALHEAGTLHRDIKPTNVLVTPGGRVVLLDFGVSTGLNGGEPRPRADNRVVGTVPYMAPEQAAATDVSAASDWYSVGVVLYESMTGRLPFRGRIPEVLAAKRDTEPPPPGTVVAGIPADLEALCVELLRRDPARRPTGREILARLEGASGGPGDCGTPAPARAVPLIGRERHRKVLDAAFASLKQGRAETLFVFGRSGTGKSTLIQSFLNDLVANEEAVVLPGRCHERESVPYKALDSVVDALSRHLAELGPDEARALLPVDVPLLARVFPVLQQIEPVAAAPRPAVETSDQRELRRRAFAALRQLLTRIGEGTPLVVAIDDLQWGDADDAALLIDLLRPPDPPPLLFVGSFRSEDAETSPILTVLLRATGKEGPEVARRELAVESLGHCEARELALTLLGQDHALARAEAHLIARESGGNPLFIGELVKHVQGGGVFSGRPPTAGAIDLDEVLWERVRRLPDEARRLLELVAVSGRPINPYEAIQAAGLAAEARAGVVALLRAARLVRSAGHARRELIETYHDRIRETVVAHLDAAVAAEHHRRLVLTLESSGGTEPEVLAFHCRGAGQLEKAARYYAKAADKAAEELAFLHAARLYRQAIDLQPEPGDADAARRLLTGLGDALANAGRGGEAAHAYLEAAASAMVAEALDLKRRAAMQLLLSGHVDEGLASLRTVLGALNMPMPDTPRRALASLLRGRARLRLRGLRFRPRDSSQVSAEDLARIDVCWSSASGLSIIDPVRGADFQARGLLLALRAGEPYRVARALAMEAAHVSTAGRPARRRVERLLAATGPIVERLDHPHLRGLIGLARAIAALMFGRWKEARDAFDHAEQTFRDRCTRVAWELDTAANLSLWAITRMGDLAALRNRRAALLKEARARGDLYAATTLNSEYTTILRLADDDPEGARCQLDAGMAHWSRSGFHIQHSTAARSRVQILLYQRQGQAAWEDVQQSWPFYSRSLLLRVQMLRIELLELRSRCALAAGAAAFDPSPYWRAAGRDAARLDRERVSWASAHACFLRACLALARGETQPALTLLADASRRYHAEDMHLEATVARRRLGELLGGEQGVEIVRETDDWLASQGVRDPDRLSAMFAPAVGKSRHVPSERESPPTESGGSARPGGR